MLNKEDLLTQMEYLSLDFEQQSKVKAILMEIKHIQNLREHLQYLDRFNEIMGPNDYSVPKEPKVDEHPVYKLTLYWRDQTSIGLSYFHNLIYINFPSILFMHY